MPPHSLCEWMLGQNISKRPKKPGGLRHVVSFEVLTDDESSSDIYKIAVPRGKLAHPSKSRMVREPAKSSLKRPSPVALDSEATTDVSEETSWDEEISEEEPDPTCPCEKCIEGRRELRRIKQATIKGRKKKSSPVTSSSEDNSEDDVAAAIHARHQAKKTRKKVSFADTSSEGSNSDDSITNMKSQSKKGKSKGAVADVMSSKEENESEDSAMEAKVEVRKKKKGTASVAVSLSSGDESESEASVAQAKPKGKKTSAVLTPDSSVTEAESDAVTARVKQYAKNKKGNSAKPKDSKGQKNTPSEKKKKNKREKSKSSKPTVKDSPEETDEDTEETEEDTEEETKTQSSKKEKQKGMKPKMSSKRENEKNTRRKKAGKNDAPKKSVKGYDTASESDFESESESEVEIRARKKAKPKPKKEEDKGPKKVTIYPPARPPPHIRQPNMLIPPRTSVMQVEHAVEDPGDPRPNAFFDNDSGTTRVYHGPAYGNPYGTLYPKRAYNYQNLPVGVPHPVQNPWYNGFPPPNGQHGPPHAPPPIGAADESNPWFRGWGTIGPAPVPPNMPPPPEFAPTKDKSQRRYAEHYNQSPPRSRAPKDRDAGWDSNVIPIPSIEVNGPNGSPAKNSNHSQGSKAGSASGRPWGAQGASGSPWSPEKPTEKKRNKKDTAANNATGRDEAFNDKLAGLGKALQQAAAKDSADLRAREERWSNRSGSSKERSPQPNSGWDDTNINHTNSGGGWGDNNNGGGSGWDAGNTNTGGDSAWDNAAANNSWGNSGGNDGWNNSSTNNNNNNNGGWDNSNNDNTGWSNDGNNGGPSNANHDGGWNESNNNNTGGWGDNSNTNWAGPQPNNNANNNTTAAWRPTGSPPSPLSRNATPIPGTWASPVLSNGSNRPGSNWSGGNVGGHGPPAGTKDKGKGKAVESGPGWGDDTLAQSSGGYWNTKEGQTDIANGRNNRKSRNGSWW